MRRSVLMGVVLMTAIPAAGADVVLENEHVRVEVSPAAGGAVTRMVHKAAATLPFIADRGARVAGAGKFFVPVVGVGERQVTLSDVKLRPRRERAGGELRLVLTGSLAEIAPGLSIERTMLLDKGESGLRIRDTYRSPARDLTLRIGAGSRQDGQPWHLVVRCWFGDRTYCPWRFTPYHAGNVDKRQARSKRLYWRMVSQYGVGLLYQVTAPRAPADMTHALPKEKGHPAAFEWLSAPVTVGKGESLTVDSAVLIDEGGRGGGGAGQLANTDRVVATLDLPRAGRSGVPVDCFATVASATARDVRLAVSGFRRLVDWKQGDTKPVKLLEQKMTLKPGLADVHHFRLKPEGPGLYYVDVAVLDEDGKEIARVGRRSAIDGESLGGKGEFGAAWTKFSRRLPEVRLKGSWEQIGRQVAAEKRFRKPRGGGSAKRLAFYDKHFPYYARLVRGAAKEMGVGPEQLAARESDDLAVASACMGLILSGPEGPIHLYSKERSGSSNRGMGYVKVVPKDGYRYHMYTLGAWSFGYGVNEKGLATSGASINCDRRTDQAGKAHTRRRADAGKMTAPIGMHMMMATCGNVDEAVAFITNPQAPLDFTGNLLVSDLTGKAVVLNSIGTYQQIVPLDGRKRFATGNYPFQREDGMFGIGRNWGWAANTMLREQRVGRYLRQRDYSVTLRDAFVIMADQAEPGNMNQHVFDNPGLLYSTCSAIAVARTGDLYVSNGPPDMVEYVRYRLKD